MTTEETTLGIDLPAERADAPPTHLLDAQGVTHAQAGDVALASERLKAAIDQLERIERLELELLREAVRVTRQAAEALSVKGVIGVSKFGE